jgi:hypothetical protein
MNFPYFGQEIETFEKLFMKHIVPEIVDR